MDSSIRLRQLNQTDLSGYIGQTLGPLLSGSGLALSGRNVIPSGSGIWNLGASGNPFNAVYTEDVVIPSGLGIHFGPYYMTAYTSGTNAVVQINGYTITTSGGYLTIAGPPGPSGATGLIGPTGMTGASVTGASGIGGTGFVLLLSDGIQTRSISLPSGATGASGVSLTGFNQSGNFARPLYSNGTTGLFLQLASGATGPKGDVGGIFMDFGQMTGVWAGNPHPTVYAPNLDPLSSSYNPTLRFVKGMRYTIGLSGLDTLNINGTGTNFYVDEHGLTGYLRFCIFSPDVSTLDSFTNYTGRIIAPETTDASSISTYIVDGDVMTNISEGTYREYLSFNVNFGAQDNYYWGVARYAPDGTLNADSSTEGVYILGSLEIDYFGPAGPSGAKGDRGIDGAQGEIGPPGVGGNPGVSITGVARSDNNIRFLFSDNTYSDWIAMPSGGVMGPQGPQGLTGPAGPSIIGPQGPQGLPGNDGVADTYFTNFDPTTVSITGNVGCINKQVSGFNTWTMLCNSTDKWFNDGDSIEFSHPDLLNKAYSPWQKVIVADGNYTGTRYFYAYVRNFDSSLGKIQLQRSDTPYPAVGMSGGHMYWYQFNTMTINLGGLGSPGISGAIGPSGAKGDAGNTGTANYLNGFANLTEGPTVLTLACQPTNSWNLTMIGESNYDRYLYFDHTAFGTGETVMIKIFNNTTQQPEDGAIIHWDTNAKFPYGVGAPPPHVGKTNIYTFVRFPDVGGVPQYYCTYSVEYP